ncbi:hypothetical protein GCM10018773_64620 [Streptomyces candidus]|nr:hypothetical protein GCM10018773_64620 [Streptomyces candidus]
MIGLPMSSLATPEARMSARAPAMLRPWVTVRDLSSGIGFTSQEYGCGGVRVRARGTEACGTTGVERTPPIQDLDRSSG